MARTEFEPATTGLQISLLFSILPKISPVSYLLFIYLIVTQRSLVTIHPPPNPLLAINFFVIFQCQFSIIHLLNCNPEFTGQNPSLPPPSSFQPSISLLFSNVQNLTSQLSIIHLPDFDSEVSGSNSILAINVFALCHI